MLAERIRGRRICFARRDQLLVEFGDPLGTGFDRGQLRTHLLAKLGQRIRFDPVLARQRADVEQSRLGLLEQRRIGSQLIGRAGDPVLGLARLDQRAVERCQCVGEQLMVGGAALDPPRRLAQPRDRTIRSAEQLVESGQRLPRLESCLHRRPFFGEAGLLALPGRKLFDLR